MSNSGTTPTKAALTLPLTISNNRKQIQLNKQTKYGKQAVFLWQTHSHIIMKKKITSMLDKLPQKKKL